MNLFEQMIERGHERITFHHDPATGLKAIIAVHNTVLGNALGGFLTGRGFSLNSIFYVNEFRTLLHDILDRPRKERTQRFLRRSLQLAHSLEELTIDEGGTAE